MNAPTEMQCLEEAGEWIVRLSDRSVSPEEIAEWVHWCEARPEHAASFERLQAGWDALEALKVSRPPNFWKRRAVWGGFALAASVLMALGLLWHERNVPAAASPKEVTASDINRSAMLPDGSSVVLSARTFVTVDYDRGARRLELSRGEAFFKVRDERSRPFVVHAGEVEITALGTAFDVRHEEEGIVVTVDEGLVEVAGQSGRLQVAAGYQVIWHAGRGRPRLARVDVPTMLRWREGQLAYLWEPLGLVIEDINRYALHRVIVRDPAIARLKYTGNVIPASVEDWVAAIEATYPVRATKLANGDLSLESVER